MRVILRIQNWLTQPSIVEGVKSFLAVLRTVSHIRLKLLKFTALNILVRYPGITF